MPDRPPGVRDTYFQAMASTLIYGKRDAVLVDAYMTVKQATALADWVASLNRDLTTIYITHGHGDHWFGVGTLLERFPRAKAVATPKTIEVMRLNASPQFLHGAWERGFPGQIPEHLVMAEELDGNVISLEGHDLIVVELGHTDTDHTTCLQAPPKPSSQRIRSSTENFLRADKLKSGRRRSLHRKAYAAFGGPRAGRRPLCGPRANGGISGMGTGLR